MYEWVKIRLLNFTLCWREAVVNKMLFFLLLSSFCCWELNAKESVDVAKEEVILSKDKFTGLYDKESIARYLAKLKRDESAPLYPMSILELKSTANVEEIGHMVLQKDHDTVIRDKNSQDSWFILLPDTDKDGADVVISRLIYHIDDFTLKNRRVLASAEYLKPSDKSLVHSLRKSEFSENCYSIAFLDIDHFKKINKEQGYQVGDKVLQLFAQTLEHNVRKGDFVGRFGGDEFVLIFKNTGKYAVKKIMLRLDGAVDQYHFSFSAGVVSIYRDLDPGLALEIAMKLCQTAKDKGIDKTGWEKMIFWSFFD